MKEINKLSPLTKFCCSIGNIPTSYMVSLSYEEQVLWLCDFLKNTVIPALNNNAEAVEELQNLYNELKTYIDNKLDNLQPLVNQKLEEMANDGTLSALLNNYSNLEKTYLTLEQMIEDETLVSGQKVKVYSKENINDGGGAYYLIGNSGSVELNNGLKATIINNMRDNYIENIIVEKERHYETDCYFTYIPVNDKYGNLIKPYVAYGNGKSPSQYAKDNYTTLTLNASLALKTNQGSEYQIPSIISNGGILRENDLINKGVATNVLYLGIKEDRSISEYPVYTTTAMDMIDDGVIQAFDVYWKLVENGNAVDISTFRTNEGVLADAVRGPRQTLGVKADGTIVILTCDGRTDTNQGLFSHEQQELMIEKGCVNAWNLDGGGSTSTTYKGVKINRNIDNGGTTDRNIPYTLNFKAEITNKENAELHSEIGKLKQDMIEQIIPDTTQNKIRAMFEIQNQVLNFDAPSDTYYRIPFRRIIGNEYSTERITMLKESDSDPYNIKFKINKLGYFKITTNVELITRATQQNRLNCYRSNEDYTIPGSDVGTSSTLATAQRIEIVNTGFINNRNVNNEYIIRLKTNRDGTINSGMIMIEEL